MELTAESRVQYRIFSEVTCQKSRHVFVFHTCANVGLKLRSKAIIPIA